MHKAIFSEPNINENISVYELFTVIYGTIRASYLTVCNNLKIKSKLLEFGKQIFNYLYVGVRYKWEMFLIFNVLIRRFVLGS